MARPSVGKRLGTLYAKLRWPADKFPPRRRAQLEEIGFPMGSEHSHWTRLVLPVLQAFKAKHGHVDVPRAFVVPVDDPSWPKHSRGLQLGLSVKRLRSGWDTLADHKRQELESIGFKRTAMREHRKHTLFPALQTYHKLVGQWPVPRSFCVPDQDPQWPEPSWKMQLGRSCANLRRASRGPLANVGLRTLRKLGCAVDDDPESDDQALEVTRRCWLEQVAPALATFERLHGHLDVPADFRVPASDAAAAGGDSVWPKQSAGIQLGAMVADKITSYDLRKHYDLYTVDFPLS